MRSFPLVVFAAISFCIVPAAGASPHNSVESKSLHRTDLRADVQRGVTRMQQWYDARTGMWTGWWNSANSLTVLVDDSRAAHTRAYYPVFANTFAEQQHQDFINTFYDDEGWWALAWIDAYDLTGKPEYLAMAKTIFADMTGGWDQTCGGGIWWNKKRHYKNAIANELFLSVAAHLADRSKGAERQGYLDWANRDWQWFAGSGMIEGDHLISDGLDDACRDNHRNKWTYNQGVIVGGLAELSRAAGDRTLLEPAREIADAAMVKLADADGVLHDKCEPHCSNDSKQFKGIFVRNLMVLNHAERDRSDRKRIKQFVRVNAESIVNRDQTPDHGFGQVWSGPAESLAGPDSAGRESAGQVDAVTQTSALDVLVADLELRRRW